MRCRPASCRRRKHRENTTYADIAFNYGSEIQTVGLNGYGEINTPLGVVPGNVAIANITELQGSQIIAGTTTSTSRMVDVDGDGRPDFATDVDTASPQIFYNLGGQFTTTSRSYPASSLDGLRRKTAANQPTLDLLWQLQSDLIDLDGDGIAESVSFLSGFDRVVHESTAPPRLLRKIINGRGTEATLTYASMHDTDAVTQDPASLWFDGRPKATPTTRWVVKALTLADQFANTTTTTSYHYTNPDTVRTTAVTTRSEASRRSRPRARAARAPSSGTATTSTGVEGSSRPSFIPTTPPTSTRSR